jgi:hypothetical protein
MAFSLHVSRSDAIIAQLCAPRSCPANKAFLRVSASGRIERSTVLESISPSFPPFGTFARLVSSHGFMASTIGLDRSLRTARRSGGGSPRSSASMS